MSTPLRFKPIGRAVPGEDQLDAFLTRKGVPELHPVTAPKPQGQPAAAATPKIRRLALELPEYVLDQIQDRARAGRCTARHVVMTALRAAGITINDTDMVSDGRRLR